MDLCSVLSVPLYGNISGKFGMVWRFLPMADPFVDFMVSRDLDSRYNTSFMHLSILWQYLNAISRFINNIPKLSLNAICRLRCPQKITNIKKWPAR